MLITLRTIRGHTFSIEIENDGTIDDLRRKVAEVSGIEEGKQRLVFDNHQINSGTLIENNITDGSFVIVSEKQQQSKKILPDGIKLNAYQFDYSDSVYIVVEFFLSNQLFFDEINDKWLYKNSGKIHLIRIEEGKEVLFSKHSISEVICEIGLKNIPAGVYKCKFNHTYNSVERTIFESKELTIGPIFLFNTSFQPKDFKIEVSFQQIFGKDVENGWIGLYEQKTGQEIENKKYVSFQYMKNAIDGRLIFTPNKSGDYAVRLFPRNDYYHIKQATVRVVGENNLILSYDGQALCAKINLCDADISLSPWLGFYCITGNSRKRLFYQYVKQMGPSEIKYNTSASGVYQVELYSTSNTVLLCESFTLN